MSKLLIALIVFGLGIGLVGANRFRLASRSTKQPLAVDLADLEQGLVVNNDHLVIGPHLADLYTVLYQWKDDRENVAWLYYPIVSESCQYVRQLRSLGQQYGSINQIPKHQWPTVDARVVVKTRRYSQLSQVPSELLPFPQVQGLVINSTQELGKNEQADINRCLPEADFSNLLVLEESRRPLSWLESIGLILGGAIFVVVGLVGCIFLSRRSRGRNVQQS